MDPRFAALLNRQGGAPADTPAVDTSEQIYISSLALLKMLKHGRAGVPMEVWHKISYRIKILRTTALFLSMDDYR